MTVAGRWRAVAGGLAAALVLAAVGFVGWRATRPAPGHHRAEPRLADADAAAVGGWLAEARAAARGPALASQGPREVVMCRVAPPSPPTCAQGAGASWGEAARAAAGGHDWLADGVVRLDVVLEVLPTRFPSGVDGHVAGAWGLRRGDRVVPPSDVLARGLFRAEEEDDDPVWDEAAVAGALGAEPGGDFPVEVLVTQTFVQDAPDAPVRPVYRLHRDHSPDTTPAGLAEPIALAGEHLLRLVAEDGRIRYRYDPRTGRTLPGQNLLRHAGTTWSLLRAHERTGDPRFVDAASRAIGYLLRKTGTDDRTGPHGGGHVRFVIEGKDHKLGGAGLALLTLATFQQRTGDTTHADAARELATFLLSQQQESGQFWSYAPKVDGGERRTTVSAYYPGEAVLGLVTWHTLDPDPRWLAAAVRGADWLIDERDGGKSVEQLDADHWLMMALDRLHAATGDARYAAHAVRLAEVVALQQERQRGHEVFHRDYAGGFYEPPRTTPATIRAEGLGAVLDLCGRTGRDCGRFVPVLHGAVSHALLGWYGPGDTWWVADPPAVLGGFAGGIVDPELRNDYTQHAYCALLAAERHPLPAEAMGRNR